MGIDDLLEGILLVADSNEIKANPTGKVVGTVIEAELDKTRGVIATLLVQNGTLEVGDVVIAGESYGKLKAMFDYKGRKVQKAGPSFPVSVLGLTSVPEAGDVFMTAESDREAREMCLPCTPAGRVKPSTQSLPWNNCSNATKLARLRNYG